MLSCLVCAVWSVNLTASNQVTSLNRESNVFDSRTPNFSDSGDTGIANQVDELSCSEDASDIAKWQEDLAALQIACQRERDRSEREMFQEQVIWRKDNMFRDEVRENRKLINMYTKEIDQLNNHLVEEVLAKEDLAAQKEFWFIYRSVILSHLQQTKQTGFNILLKVKKNDSYVTVSFTDEKHNFRLEQKFDALSLSCIEYECNAMQDSAEAHQHEQPQRQRANFLAYMKSQNDKYKKAHC